MTSDAGAGQIGPTGASRALIGRAPTAAPRAHGLPGALIVLEGIDQSGRSTQARLLEEHLRYRGRGVARTSLATSFAAGEAIRRAKADRRILGSAQMTLLYAADLSERIDQIIVPSLRAGLIVIADRYVYTPMARAEARGLDRDWLDGIFDFVIPPDLVLYLDVPAELSVERRLRRPGPPEAELDPRLDGDQQAGYGVFQERLRACFDRYVERFRFTRVDGTGPIDTVAGLLAGAADGLLAAAWASR